MVYEQSKENVIHNGIYMYFKMFLKYFYSDNNGLLSVHFTGQTFVFGFRPSTVIDSMIIPYPP